MASKSYCAMNAFGTFSWVAERLVKLPGASYRVICDGGSRVDVSAWAYVVIRVDWWEQHEIKSTSITTRKFRLRLPESFPPSS